MGNFNTATPAGTDLISLGDDNIRELKTALQEALRGGTTEGLEAVFPGTAPTTAPVFHYRGLKGNTGARPASGQFGLYFDTARNVLQRDNGSTWEDVGSVIPSGTVMVFYQAAAPVGWTKVVTQNDKALRVVSGDGGGTGGTHALSTPPSTSHNHNGATGSTALTTAQMPSHHHAIYSSNSAGGLRGAGANDADGLGFTAGNGTYGFYDDFSCVQAHTHTDQNGAYLSDEGGGGGHTHSLDSSAPTAFSPQYIDVIICSKD